MNKEKLSALRAELHSLAWAVEVGRLAPSFNAALIKLLDALLDDGPADSLDPRGRIRGDGRPWSVHSPDPEAFPAAMQPGMQAERQAAEDPALAELSARMNDAWLRGSWGHVAAVIADLCELSGVPAVCQAPPGPKAANSGQSGQKS